MVFMPAIRSRSLPALHEETTLALMRLHGALSGVVVGLVWLGCNPPPTAQSTASALPTAPASTDHGESAPPVSPAPRRFSVVVNRPDTFFAELDRAIGGPKGAGARWLFGGSEPDLAGDERVTIEATGGASKPTLKAQQAARENGPPSLSITFAESDGLASVPPLIETLVARLTAALSRATELPADKRDAMSVLLKEERDVAAQLTGVRQLTVTIEQVDPNKTQLRIELALNRGDFPLTKLARWLDPGNGKVAPDEALVLCPEPSAYLFRVPAQDMQGSPLNALETLLPTMVEGDAWREPLRALGPHLTSPVVWCQGAAPDGFQLWQVTTFDDGGKSARAALKSVGRAKGVSAGQFHYELSSSNESLVVRFGDTKDKANVIAMRVLGPRLVCAMGGPAVLKRMKRIERASTLPALSSALLDGAAAAVVDLSALLGLDQPTRISAGLSSTQDSLQLRAILDDGAMQLLHRLSGPAPTQAE